MRVPFWGGGGQQRKGSGDMVAKPAPCWRCLEEQHQLYNAQPEGIDYTPPLRLNRHQRLTQTGVSGQGEGESGAFSIPRDLKFHPKSPQLLWVGYLLV